MVAGVAQASDQDIYSAAASGTNCLWVVMVHWDRADWTASRTGLGCSNHRFPLNHHHTKAVLVCLAVGPGIFGTTEC